MDSSSGSRFEGGIVNRIIGISSSGIDLSNNGEAVGIESFKIIPVTPEKKFRIQRRELERA